MYAPKTPEPRRDRFQIIELEERIAPSLLDVDVDVRNINVSDNLNHNNINAVSVGNVLQRQ